MSQTLTMCNTTDSIFFTCLSLDNSHTNYHVELFDLWVPILAALSDNVWWARSSVYSSKPNKAENRCTLVCDSSLEAVLDQLNVYEF